MSISAVIQPVRLVSLRATAAAALRVRSKSTRVRAVHRSATIMAAGDLTANPLASWSFGRSPPSDAPDLPKWSSITPEHVKPAIMAAVDKVNATHKTTNSMHMICTEESMGTGAEVMPWA